MARDGQVAVLQEMIDESGVIVWSGTMMGVMAYNTNIVPPDKAPGGWQSCLDPQWKGKFSVDTKPNVLTSLVSAWGEEKLLDFAKRLKGNNPILLVGRAVSWLNWPMVSFLLCVMPTYMLPNDC